MRNFRKHRDAFGLYKSPNYYNNSISKSAFSDTAASKHAVKVNSCAECYYYVLNVNRARVKRHIKSRLLNKNDNIC